MAAYTFRAAGTIASNNDSSELAPGAPAGKAVGDALFLVTVNYAAAVAPAATPTGWVLISNFETGPSVYVYARKADGTGDDTPTVDWAGTVDSIAVILAYQGDVYVGGFDTLKIGALGVNVSQASPALPTLRSPLADDSMMVAVSVKRKTATSNDATSHTAPGSFSKRAELIMAGTALTFVVADWQQTTATLFDGTDFTIDGTAEAGGCQGVVFSVKSSSSPPSTIRPDVATTNLRTDTASPQVFSHAGAASGVRGVLVGIIHGVSATDHVSAVTYGGAALARVQRNTDTVDEPGAAEWWFLGEGVPQGTQDVLYVCGATDDDIFAVCETLLADADLEIVDADGVSENATDPSVTLESGGREVFPLTAFYSGVAAPSNVTRDDNVTSLGNTDFGNNVGLFHHAFASLFVDFTIAFTAALEDVALAAVGVSPVESGGALLGQILT